MCIASCRTLRSSDRRRPSMYQSAYYRSSRVVFVGRVGTDEGLEQALTGWKLLLESRPEPIGPTVQ